MLRGFRVIAITAALAATALTAGPAGAAERNVERLLAMDISAQATNGYDFRFSAARTQPGGATAMISVGNENSSAFYILRQPRLVNKRRIVADFGETGKVSLRFEKRFSNRRGNRRCGHTAFRFGTFRGGIRFEGESGFTRVRSNRATGAIFSIVQRRRCGSLPGVIGIPRARTDDSAILSSCGGESGAGFFAADLGPGGGTEFLASKIERTAELTIIRILSIEGATRHLDVSPDGTSAKVRPPEPFSGRAAYRKGELTGNLEVPLPGAGQVRLTPGDSTLTGFEDFDFDFPKCFPPFFLSGSSGSSSVSGSRAAIYDVLTRTALTPMARRIFAR